jgi:hypothetical protein
MAKNGGKLPTKPTGKAAKGEIADFLRQVAATPVSTRPGERGRLIFAMDATASREPTWDRACHIQAQMFQETAALGGLEIQLVFYRGFGEFKASPWLTRSDELLRRMTRVFCLGGQTQIEKVLQRAIVETKTKRVNALVFVGDCMEEDVDRLCHQAGELGVLGVPAFLFHEGGEPVARRAFQQIARLSHGARQAQGRRGAAPHPSGGRPVVIGAIPMPHRGSCRKLDMCVR